MSDHHFGVEKKKYSRTEIKKIEKIEQECGVTHVRANIPGEGDMAWFAVRDYGEPWNGIKRTEVRAAMERAGLWAPQD